MSINQRVVDSIAAAAAAKEVVAAATVAALVVGMLAVAIVAVAIVVAVAATATAAARALASRIRRIFFKCKGLFSSACMLSRTKRSIAVVTEKLCVIF